MGRAFLAGVFAVSVLAGAAMFFALAPEVVDRRLNRLPNPITVTQAQRAQAAPLFIADLHADTLLWKRPLTARSLRGHVDAPRLREGGVNLQVFASVTQLPRNGVQPLAGHLDPLSFLSIAQLEPPATWTSPLARARQKAARLNAAAARFALLALVRDQGDLAAVRAARAEGRDAIGAVLALEGLHALEGELENLGLLFEDGYRIFGLHHFFDNALGGSLHGDQQAGLTDFGREVVLEIERRQGVVDLAHSSPAVVRDVLDTVARPVIVSHTGFRGACDSPRNLSDELMMRIAERGGLIGVGFWAGAVCDASPAGIAEAVRYGVDLVGADHVALGSDFDGATALRFDAAQIPVLVTALADTGLEDEVIRKVMGENAARFFATYLPASEDA